MLAYCALTGRRVLFSPLRLVHLAVVGALLWPRMLPRPERPRESTALIQLSLVDTPKPLPPDPPKETAKTEPRRSAAPVVAHVAPVTSVVVE